MLIPTYNTDTIIPIFLVPFRGHLLEGVFPSEFGICFRIPFSASSGVMKFLWNFNAMHIKYIFEAMQFYVLSLRCNFYATLLHFYAYLLQFNCYARLVRCTLSHLFLVISSSRY